MDKEGDGMWFQLSMPWKCGNCGGLNCEPRQLMCKDEIAQIFYDHFGIPYAIGFAIGQASFYDGTWFGVKHGERVYRNAAGRS